MNQQKSKYSSSFTAGALLLKEFQAISVIIDQPGLQDILTREKEENQYLRIKTELARKRVITEIKRRLKYTPDDQWELFNDSDEAEQKIFLFYVILNAQPLVKDLHFEVAVEKWLRLDKQIEKIDFQMKLEEIESWDQEVASWSTSTKTKVLTQMIRILTEAGLLNNGELVKPEIYNDQFWKKFIQWDAAWFLQACLLSSKEIEALK